MSTLRQKLAALTLGISLATVLTVLVTCHSSEDIESDDMDPLVLAKHDSIQRAQPAANLHRQEILAGMEAGLHEDWEGSYAWSNGFESRVMDLNRRGFCYEYSHCTGTGELAYGRVASVEGSRVHLAFLFRECVDESPRDGRANFRMDDELYSVPWAGERFLVPAVLMQEFCELALATGWDSMMYANYPRKIRSGEETSWFMRESVLGGLPEVPPEFRHFLPGSGG